MIARASRAWGLAVGAALLVLGDAARADAELVFFRTGRVLSVASVRVDPATGRATLVLRGGGEVECDVAVLARVAPDEVPPPGGDTPAPETTAAAASLEDRPYAALIRSAAAAHGVDERLVHAVVEVESAYRPDARSPRGARGLMQLMPATAARYDVRALADPAANLQAGIRHLRELLDRYDLPLALAAYNAGEGAVRRHGGIPPYPETESYVRRILQRLAGR